MYANYTIEQGYMLARVSFFYSFAMALSIYQDLVTAGIECRLLGIGAEPGDEDGSGASDGLNEHERDAILEVC